MSATYNYVFDIFLKIIFQNTKKLPLIISEIQKIRRNGLKIEFHNVKKLHQKYFGHILKILKVEGLMDYLYQTLR